MKDYSEVRFPYLSAACKPDTSIAAHVVIYCDCGSQVDIVRYYGTGRCRIFVSGSADYPDDKMTIYSSLRRLPSSLFDLLRLAAHFSDSVVSCTYDSSALHLIHYGNSLFQNIRVGVPRG